MKRSIFLTTALILAIPCLALSGKQHLSDMREAFPTNDPAVVEFYKQVNLYLDNPYRVPGERPRATDPKRPRCVADNPTYAAIRWDGRHRIWYHWGYHTDPSTHPPLCSSLHKAVLKGTITRQDSAAFWPLLRADEAERQAALMQIAATAYGYGDMDTLSEEKRAQLDQRITVLYAIHILGDHTTPDSLVIQPLAAAKADIPAPFQPAPAPSHSLPAPPPNPTTNPTYQGR